jgi:hypothetical protein
METMLKLLSLVQIQNFSLNEKGLEMKRNWKAHVEEFPFIYFENPLYISYYFGEKEGKEDGICH